MCNLVEKGILKCQPNWPLPSRWGFRTNKSSFSIADLNILCGHVVAIGGNLLLWPLSLFWETGVDHRVAKSNLGNQPIYWGIFYFAAQCYISYRCRWCCLYSFFTAFSPGTWSWPHYTPQVLFFCGWIYSDFQLMLRSSDSRFIVNWIELCSCLRPYLYLAWSMAGSMECGVKMLLRQVRSMVSRTSHWSELFSTHRGVLNTCCIRIKTVKTCLNSFWFYYDKGRLSIMVLW
jgi:hypothetical protein